MRPPNSPRWFGVAANAPGTADLADANGTLELGLIAAPSVCLSESPGSGTSTRCSVTRSIGSSSRTLLPHCVPRRQPGVHTWSWWRRSRARSRNGGTLNAPAASSSSHACVLYGRSSCTPRGVRHYPPGTRRKSLSWTSKPRAAPLAQTVCRSSADKPRFGSSRSRPNFLRAVLRGPSRPHSSFHLIGSIIQPRCLRSSGILLTSRKVSVTRGRSTRLIRKCDPRSGSRKSGISTGRDPFGSERSTQIAATRDAAAPRYTSK